MAARAADFLFFISLNSVMIIQRKKIRGNWMRRVKWHWMEGMFIFFCLVLRGRWKWNQRILLCPEECARLQDVPARKHQFEMETWRRIVSVFFIQLYNNIVIIFAKFQHLGPVAPTATPGAKGQQETRQSRHFITLFRDRM